MILLAHEVRIGSKAEKGIFNIKRSGKRTTVARILSGLREISEDPYRSRPGADILRLRDIDPRMYRLRIGDYRVVYEVDEDEHAIYVTGVLHRKRAYGGL